MVTDDVEQTGEAPIRQRILDAAFSAFAERGFAETSTLEIAKRAKASKRELYALVGRKQDMLVACITERAARMRPPADLPVPGDREALAALLAGFGERLLREVTDPAVIAVFRLAIAEAEKAPEIARSLESIGRAANRAALREVLAKARDRRLLDGDPAAMADRFTALLWGNLLVGLLLRVVEPPDPEESKRIAHDAATALLRLH